MNDTERERAFLDRLKTGLDAGLEELDPTVVARLRESRRMALAGAGQSGAGLCVLPRLLPVGAFATLAVVALTFSLWFSTRQQIPANGTTEEIEVLTVQGNLDMYRDLEFYQWLAQNRETR